MMSPIYAGFQLEVLEPASLLLRQMPRFRGVSEVDVAGRAFEDLSEFLHYRCVIGPECRRSDPRVQVIDSVDCCSCSSMVLPFLRGKIVVLCVYFLSYFVNLFIFCIYVSSFLCLFLAHQYKQVFHLGSG